MGEQVEPRQGGGAERAAVRSVGASWNSPLSVVGVAVVLLGALLLVTFGLFNLISPTSNPYLDVFGYLVIPVLIVFGLVVAVVGVVVRRWRIRRLDPMAEFHRFPRIDLNDPRQRRTVAYLGGFVVLMVPVVVVSSYHGYQFTDSVAFCTESCHQVMEPEATTYPFSAHARVACAECHIGAGASWFIKAKISGVRQVVAVLRNTYPRPIPPAIQHLRPAAETCEQCHWPRKFYGAQLRERVHFAEDEANSRRDIQMLVKTGGGDEMTGRVEGIHMHMLLSGRMEYVATDTSLQTIPWVKWTRPNGEELVYRADGKPTEAPPPPGERRHLDCMDCHNRPAHKFPPPAAALDLYLARGRIDASLPYIKREATRVLVAPYPDPSTARSEIANRLTTFYRKHYPAVWETNGREIELAISRVQEIYGYTFFPEMQVDWRTYPDNIGHLYAPGCFRCHDGRHRNRYGDTIGRDCNLCHDFLSPVQHEAGRSLIRKGAFVHPFELTGIHATLMCYRCHTGALLDPTCGGCHVVENGLYTATAPALYGYGVVASPMSGSVECEGCHDLSQDHPASDAAVGEACAACHDEQHRASLTAWRVRLAAVRGRADAALARGRRASTEMDGGAASKRLAAWLRRSETALRFLREAGPLHNPEAAVAVCERIARGFEVAPPAPSGGG